jgi:broad specificity phosphatase PhoE
MTLLLIRHGETDWNREPARCQGWAETEINEVGRAQVRDLGRALAGRGLELIVSSHLVRARQTAELLHEELGGDLSLIVDPRLAEAHRGVWETERFISIMHDDPDGWRHYREHPESFRFPGGESLVDQERRVLACLQDCVQDGRRAALVTHGGSIRLVRGFLSGEGPASFHATATETAGVDEVPVDALVRRLDAAAGRPAGQGAGR